MIKRVGTLTMCLVLNSILSSANANDVIGWHWYNELHVAKKTQKKNQATRLLKQFNHLSPVDQLKVLQQATRALRDKAILSGKVVDIAAYKKAQDFWLNKATRFTVGWEQMLLAYPSLDYSLQYSHENALAPIVQKAQHRAENKAVERIGQSEGLLFFYRGRNKGDVRFSKIIRHYAKANHLVLMPVSIDDKRSPYFKQTTYVNGLRKAYALRVSYFPALILVNPRTHQHRIVSYGFKSENELSDRLFKIATNWKPNF